MVRAFLFSGVALLVEARWLAEQPGYPAERGARVEVRLLEQMRRDHSESAQRVVIGRAVWRADLFDRVDDEPGNLGAAHFHPRFDGVDAGERVFAEDLRRNPKRWLAAQLSDLPGLLDRGGTEAQKLLWVSDDGAAIRAALPAVHEAVDRALEEARRRDP